MPIQMIVYMFIFAYGVLSIFGTLAYLWMKAEDYFMERGDNA
jgi:hypothetical protein